jgi:hypothetical protein
MDNRKINTEEYRETITSDEALLEDFFNSCHQEIADNGFTEKVMKGLPVSASWLNKIWTIVCVMTGIAFLYFTHALQGLADSLKTMATQLHSLNPTPTMLLSVILTLSALTVIGSYSFFQREDF